MKKISISIVIIFILIINGLISISTNGQTRATDVSHNKYYVDDKPNLYRDGTAEYPFNSIQQAIDAANEGDIIYVFGGEYNETLIIDKELTLIGSIEEGKSIIYYGASHKYTIKITADHVNFTGFEVRDTQNNIQSYIGGALIHISSSSVIFQRNTVTNCNNGNGMFLDSSDDNLIKDNIINTTLNGIYGESSKTNDLVNNDISNCSAAAIEIKNSDYNILYANSLRGNIYGLVARNCNDLTIRSCVVHDNNLRGVGLYDCANSYVLNNSIYDNVGEGLYISSNNCEIIGNKLRNNVNAIRIDKANSIIKNNYFNESSVYGIIAYSDSSDNLIYLNSFNNNRFSAVDQGNNIWYYDKQGNYWDDYNAIDFKLDGTCDGCTVEEQINHSLNGVSDGIGDTYYTKGGVLDEYPLGVFLKAPNKPILVSPSDGVDGVNLKFSLQVDVADQNNDVMDVYFYRLVNVSTTNETDYDPVLMGVDTMVSPGATATLPLTLKFDTIFIWQAYVTDGTLVNLSDIWFFYSKQTPGNNIPPVANIIIDEKIGNKVTFNASNSEDEDGDIEFYRWNFGDDTSEIISVKPTHTYKKAGTHTVTLTVIDNNGSSDKDTYDIVVGDGGIVEALKVDFLGSYSGKTEGEEITFVGTATGGTGLYASYSWDFGDDISGSGKSIAHTYQNTGSYTVNLTVEDTDGQDQMATMTIEIVEPKEKKSSDDSPGFGFIIIFAGIGIMLYLQKRNKKMKI